MKQYLIYIYVIFLSANVMAQEDVLQLSSVQTAGGTIQGCTGVTLLPGFSFKADVSKSLIVNTNIGVCQPSSIKTGISTDQNYIVTITPTRETKSVMFTNGQLTIDRTLDIQADALVNVQYFDGLGRPNQQVQRGITPKRHDLISLINYDAYGRESNVWLPAVIEKNNGKFVAESAIKSNSISSNGGDTKPYSTPIYEASPLNRIIEQYGPGNAWHQDYSSTKGKAVRTAYKTNIAGNAQLNCVIYKTTGTNDNPVLTKGSNYSTNQLYVTEIKDEDNNVSYEFKDKLGQVVLTRQINNGVNHDTYYVYNDYGNLCFVLPPLIEGNITADNLNKYAYQYKYDHRNRCTWKKLPGAEHILYVYDKADQMIFTQDGEQRKKTIPEWTFNIYDAFGRVLLTGIHKTKDAHQTLVTLCESKVIKETEWKDSPWGYTWNSFPSGYLNTDSPILANYYDKYNYMISRHGNDIINKLGYKGDADYGQIYLNPTMKDNTPKGMLTGNRTRYFDGTGKVVNELITTMYYDNRGRVIQTHSTNHLGGTDSEYIAYNFTGQPTKKKHVHSATGKTTQTEVYDYTYDHALRLKETKHNGTVIAFNNYDELGRLISNKKGNNANLDTKYTYNIRSWATSMKSNTLHINLDYTYGGNVKSQAWTQEGKQRKYDFTYDGLSRLLTAGYSSSISTEKYATSYSYDKHGNIMQMVRNGLTATSAYGQVDNLAMAYVGNQLNNVHNTGVKSKLTTSAHFQDYSVDAAKTKKEYTYNANGAMTQDLNKGITKIQYNSLNLPQQMDIKSPVAEARNEYTYSAGGQKLKVYQKWNPNFSTSPIIGSDVNVSSMTASLTTDYVGNKIYENGALKRILIDGGYIEGGVYHYYLTDHLGNNRVVANASGGVIQRTHYYPFGMSFADQTGGEKQPYKYNGKELDTKHGLNTYDYSARYQDPSIGRFTSIDPHAENYFSWSPYVYVTNNPMNYIDPNGCDTIGINNDNEVVWTIEADGPDVIMGSTNVVEVTPSESNNGEGTSTSASMLPAWFSSMQDRMAIQEANKPPMQSGRIDGLGAMSPEFLVLSLGRGLFAKGGATTAIAPKTTTALTANSGRIYAGHVLQRFAERGITKKMAETAITKGARYYDPKNNTINYVLKNGFASGKDLLIGVNNATGKVTTAIRGSNLVKKRFIPL